MIWNGNRFLLSENITNNQTINGPGNNSTIISSVKNLSMEAKNITSILSLDNNNTITIRTLLTTTYNNHGFINLQFLFSNQETRLVVLSLLFGMLGGSIHGIGSLVSWIGVEKIGRSYGF